MYNLGYVKVPKGWGVSRGLRVQNEKDLQQGWGSEKFQEPHGEKNSAQSVKALGSKSLPLLCAPTKEPATQISQAKMSEQPDGALEGGM